MHNLHSNPKQPKGPFTWEMLNPKQPKGPFTWEMLNPKQPKGPFTKPFR